MRTQLRPGSRARRSLLLTLVGIGALSACRQTVVLDPSANGDAGPRTGAAGTGGGGQDGAVDLGPGGGPGGFRFDAGRFEVLTNACPPGNVDWLTVVPRTPDVVISVDRSAPMQTWWGAQSRLETVQDQVWALVQQYNRAIHFGYQEFPATNSAMCGNGPGCCAGAVTPPQQKNLNQIENALHACDNGGPSCSQNQRPAADALARISRTYSSFGMNGNPKHSRYVVLVLGGDPTCGDQGGGADSGASTCGEEAAVTEVQKLNAMSIFTHVFGVGDEAGTAPCLKDLAAAGGVGNALHLAQTPSALSSALGNTITTIAQEACDLDVLDPPADNRTVTLLFDGVIVPNNPTNGWDFDPKSTLRIRVNGTWCDTLLHTMRVDAVAGCVTPRR